MRQLVVIKTGRTFPSLAAQKGDFEDWILSGMGIERRSVAIVDVCRGDPLPGDDEISGIIITGSHSMLTEQHDWSERTAAWLARAVERQVPTLGICYGHQLLAFALGGQVANNPNGREYGTTDIHLNSNASRDRLLGGLPASFKAHVSHTQSVVRLPPSVTLLASSERDPHQAFAIGDFAWGVQFHPEVDAAVARAYIEHEWQSLSQEGHEPAQLLASVQDTPHAASILKRFAELIAC